MAKILGMARIKVDGATLQTKAGGSVMLGGVKGTARSGHDVYGYSESIDPSEVEVTVYLTRNMPMQAIRDAREVVISFVTDIGISYVVTGAWISETPKVTDGEGEVTVKFQGPPAVEKT